MKYELVHTDTQTVNSRTLTRIRALIDIPFKCVKAGDLGGYIEKELNLSQKGTCWVSDNARVFGNAHVGHNAHVYDTTFVYGGARVYDNARVSGEARVSGTAQVSGNACVSGTATVSSNACVSGDAHVSSNARIDSDDKVMWFSNVGSENGTLTVYATETGLDCTRGCFTGTIDEFLAASAVTHANNARIREEYIMAINLAKFRIRRK